MRWRIVDIERRIRAGTPTLAAEFGGHRGER